MKDMCQRKDEAFTLLEILIAIMVMAIATSSILGLFAAGSAAHVRGSDYIQMSLAAQVAYSDIEIQLHHGWNPKTLSNVAISGYPDYVYDARFEILDVSIQAYVLDLTIIWKRRGQGRTETFKTVVLRKTNL